MDRSGIAEGRSGSDQNLASGERQDRSSRVRVRVNPCDGVGGHLRLDVIAELKCREQVSTRRIKFEHDCPRAAGDRSLRPSHDGHNGDIIDGSTHRDDRDRARMTLCGHRLLAKFGAKFGAEGGEQREKN